eukprot:scaffold4164_cov190-Ochromonas_danica.AAC.4
MTQDCYRGGPPQRLKPPGSQAGVWETTSSPLFLGGPWPWRHPPGHVVAMAKAMYQAIGPKWPAKYATFERSKSTIQGFNYQNFGTWPWTNGPIPGHGIGQMVAWPGWPYSLRPITTLFSSQLLAVLALPTPLTSHFPSSSPSFCSGGMFQSSHDGGVTSHNQKTESVIFILSMKKYQQQQHQQQPDDHVKSHKSSSDKTHQEGRDESKRSNHSQSTQDMLFTEEDSLPEREIDHAFRKKYRIVRFLGHGASANVYLIKEKVTQELLACKKVEINRSNRLNDRKTIQAEIEVFRRCHHPNIVQLHDLYQTEKKAWMLLEFIQGGDLLSALSQLPLYSERSIAKLFKQVLLGVQHLHEQGIIHRDLKIENLLCERTGQTQGTTSSTTTDEIPSPVEIKAALQSVLTSNPSTMIRISPPAPVRSVDDLTIKITDFGLSAVLPNWVKGQDQPNKDFNELKEKWGTFEYFAPEVYQRAYGFQADVWSLGCILYEMLTGRLAFPRRERHQSWIDRLLLNGFTKPKRMFEQRVEWSGLSSDAKSLIKGMLKRDPKKRFDIATCLAHPWIQNANSTKNVRKRTYDVDRPQIRKRMMERYVREQRHNAAYAKTIPPVQPITPSPSLDCLATMG